jgi:hypothetical protein
MIVIDFPNEPLRIEVKSGVRKVFCLVRNKWLVLTPEEWVRQYFLLYLNRVKQYPLSIIAVEKLLQVGERSRRTDILVYKNDAPFLLVECKQMDQEISTRELEQTLHYFSAVQCPYFVITNGRTTYGFTKIGEQLRELNNIPVYK